MNNTIYQHINTEHNGKPVRATLCAVKNKDGNINVGSSVCSVKDNFTRQKGRDIALQRALDGGKVQEDVVYSWDFDLFLFRAMKYFKGATYENIKYSYVS